MSERGARSWRLSCAVAESRSGRRHCRRALTADSEAEIVRFGDGPKERESRERVSECPPQRESQRAREGLNDRESREISSNLVSLSDHL
ncbi:hypothetical protein EUGRSUZ_G00546 [Eucalyptus grandis]|uniref:Uncharacterized protein n=2 Tax=Eucalyptus grandis TaxID=71139 RepID=A0ACC3JZV2_EUCGR|nr:hypothetical protein EUGRSUZ_G00546 [Eucalyptus grandis]